MTKPDTDTIAAWEDDPGAPPSRRSPVQRPRPDLDAGPLPVGVVEPEPADDVAASLRWWTAAETLRRTADLFGPLMPDGVGWHPAVGPVLRATLDAGEDLNAYYDRAGVSFFHQNVAGVTVWSGESPDVVSHEAGHAVLDALRPQLWDAASAEVAAFHESFGDCTALLAALRLESLRVEVLSQTRGRLTRSSRLSRLAEQLGWAIRQVAPTAVEPDCLRDASNRLFYRDPVTLPPSAPAGSLSSEPHSFSRVFTGAFLRVLAGVFAAGPTRDADGLRAAAADTAALLVSAVGAAPVVPAYYAQIAAHMITADERLFDGAHGRALRGAFVRHGILSPSAAANLTGAAAAAVPPVGVGAPRGVAGGGAERGLRPVRVAGGDFGMTRDFAVLAPGQRPRFAVAGAALDRGQLPDPGSERVATSFVEDLFRQGRVAVPDDALMATAAPVADSRTVTHEISDGDEGLVLVRRVFD